ncbi:MAG: histidine phosphatase family protein [Actinomycetota bacterium]|nr:histidine phosphatase family protein [Actinomycetota bacterium]
MSLDCVVLWRHGETDYNTALRMQGQSDESLLTEVGLAQAQRAAPVLAALRPDALVTSDLSRAVLTARVLGEYIGLEPDLDKRLRETHLGRWQGLTRSEVDAGWPGGRARWRDTPGWSPPGGETRLEVATRASQLVDELDAAGHRRVVLCTHGGLISGLTPFLLGLPAWVWPLFKGINNCHWTVLRRERGRWRLEAYNTAAPV